MTLNIPDGWEYIGDRYPTSKGMGSYSDESDANENIASLRHVFPLSKFDIVFDDRGGPGYGRWIIIVKRNFNSFRKKSKSIKPKRKCSCKK